MFSLTINFRFRYFEGIDDIPHGLTGRRSNAALPYEEIQAIRMFISRKALAYGRFSPVEVSKNELPPIHLPTGTEKTKLYMEYFDTRRFMNKVPASSSTFKRVWDRDLPHIKIRNRRTDLCNKCDILLNKMHSGGRSDGSKDQDFEEYSDHRKDATLTRQDYKQNRRSTAQCFLDHGIGLGSSFPAGQFPLEALNTVRMIAYDYAQYNFVPNNTDQRNSVYYKVI